MAADQVTHQYCNLEASPHQSGDGRVRRNKSINNRSKLLNTLQSILQPARYASTSPPSIATIDFRCKLQNSNGLRSRVDSYQFRFLLHRERILEVGQGCDQRVGAGIIQFGLMK